MLEQKAFLLKTLFSLCMYIGISSFSFVVSQILLGSKISVVENNAWVSSNGNFAFRFNCSNQQPNLFSVGIHFNSDSIPKEKQMVVWVAGADITVGNKSFFQLTRNGEIVLFDSLKGVNVWTSKTRNLDVASAILRNNGNLVLLNIKNDVVWQSFDTQSDTLLPGQRLSEFQTLRATSKNSVSSYYSLFINFSGQLQLRWESSVVYWTSASPPRSNLSAILSSDGALQLFDETSENPIWSVFGEDHHDEFISLRFLRLDVDGNLRLYSWVENLKSWRSVWQAVENQCDVFATCGLHGICAFNISDIHICKCPFRPLSEFSSSSQCLLPYGHECASGTTIITYAHTKLYGIYPPNDTVTQTSLRQCRNGCLGDALCTAVTFTNDGTGECRMKKTKYITGYSNPSLSSISFVKMCLDPMAVLPNITMSSPPRFNHNKLVNQVCVPCLIGAASGTLLTFLVIQIGIGVCIYNKRKLLIKKAALEAYKNRNSKGLLVFTYAELMELTENLTHEICSSMFRGRTANNMPFAVKTLNAPIEEKKFRGTAIKIGSLHHKHLLKMEGYCCESNHRFLVYEFAENGSVDKYIYDEKLCKTLTWRKRFDICLSVARAISYLHSGCREFMNHGNLKWENVVFDENFDAKVTEFGLKGVHNNASDDADIGSTKDIEDFGKMILTLITGVDDIHLDWVYKEWIEARAAKMVDARIGNLDGQELERLLRISFWCLQNDERMRPSMGEVVKVLEGTLSVDQPPPPFACSRSQERLECEIES